MAREFLGTVTDGRLELFSDQRDQMRQHIKDWSCKVVVTVRPFKSQRSVAQNARYWALLTVGARSLGWDSTDDLHESCAMKLLRLPDDEATGLPRRQRTPKLNTAEFAEYTDAVMRLLLEFGADLSDWDQETEKASAA